MNKLKQVIEDRIIKLQANNRHVDNHYALSNINLLNSILEEYKKSIMIDDVVCRHFNIELDKVYYASRKRDIVLARQVIIYIYIVHLARREGEVMSMFSQSRANAYYCIKSVNNLIDTDKDFKAKFNGILKQLDL